MQTAPHELLQLGTHPQVPLLHVLEEPHHAR
jgi:hypothetical protein